MQLTDVRFSKPKYTDGAIKQFASICLDDCLIIRGLRIVETKNNELFVSFPNRKLLSGDRFFSSFPTQNDFREYVEETVLEEYKKMLEKDL